METKILKAVFGGGTSTVTNKRTRTDYGQVLEISGVDLPETFECIFSNSSTSAGVGKKMIGSSQRVLIPDEYLTTGQTIYAWILLHDSEDDGRHMYSVRIPVADMPDTSPEEPTPVEQSVISQAITALNSAVTTTSQKAQEATESADRAEQAAEGAEGYAERAEAAQSASESARDRATQAETSARTSAATASEKASEAISSAATASQSALTAESASESAQEYATASAESAEQASQSADTASESASASAENALFTAGKALDASNSASEAAQSASTAVQAKTDAITAKTASQTAQGLAESARDGAVSAKTGAESARDEAQEIVDGITGKVEQIDSNTDRIESLEDDRYKPYPTDTASGSIASFPDGADDIPLKSCIVQVEPVQDLHGYDSPWPAGGGTNTLDPESLIEQYPDPAYGLAIARSGEWLTINGTYSSEIQSPQFRFMKKKDGSTFDDTYWAFPDSNSSNNIPGWISKADSNKTLAIGLQNMTQGTTYSLRFRLMGVTDTTRPADYLPYENICPITGWTGCEVRHSGEDTSNPTTYPITFPTEAGTVYGGYVDVTGGELVVDRAMVDLGTLTWNYYTGTTNLPVFYARLIGMAISSTNIAVCSALKCTDWQPLGSRTDKTICPHPSLDNIYVADADRTDHDVSAFVTSVTGVRYCYPLATPIHYPLTPTEIKTLLGQNNLWANTGDTEVEYRADTKLYISRLTEPDADMVADANITEGSYFMVGNNLYLATANIASGANVIVGTNATKVSLAQALNAIKG